MQHSLFQAQQFFEQGALDEAEAAAGQALTLLPHTRAAQRLLGLIAAVRQDFARALALLEPIGAAAPDDAMVQTALAETIWATRSAEAAIPYLQRALHAEPGRHRVRGRLGLALLQSGQPEAARLALHLALDARPEDGVLHMHLALVLRELGRLGEAIESLRAAVQHAPDLGQAHTALGEALLEAGDAPSAMAALAGAVRRDPGSHLAWMLLGRAANLTGHTARAAECYRRALETLPPTADPDEAMPALTALANALHDGGQAEAARASFARLTRLAERPGRRWTRRARRVGVLAAPGAANTPSDYVIDRTILCAEPVFVIDGQEPCPSRLRDRFDVLFNAISDPDEAGSALDCAGRLCGETGRQVINPPAAIRPTTREAMAQRLADLPGAVVPFTRRCARSALLEGAVALPRFPLLLRPVGSHGGASIVRADEPRALAEAASSCSAAELYLTEFCDFRSPDGLWRKYRMMFVGGVAYPYHLSIGHDWLNHYFRTGTNRDPALRAEECAFLDAPQTALGPVAMRAMQALSQRVPLDYYGVDFALAADGRLILFECNAAMRVRGAREPGSAKARAAETIRSAMTQLLLN